MSELGALLDEMGRAATASARFETPVGSVRLAVTAPEVLEWPVGYLAPGFTAVPVRDVLDGEWSVVVSSEPGHHDRLVAAVAGLPHTAAETYESRPAGRVEVEGGHTVLRYPGDEGVTVVDRDRRRVAYVDRDLGRAGFESARLVREVVRRVGEESGEVVLHAGAVVLAGRAWVICGAKGAGKTTSVCALMEHADAVFIANDRVHLRRAAGFDVRAWPMSTRIGVGTCAASSRLRPLLAGGRFAYPQTGWDPHLGLSAEAVATHVARGSGPKIELVTQELCEVLEAGATGSAPVGGVLLPARGAAAPGIAVADPADARAVLLDQVFTPDDDAYPDWLELRVTPREVLWQRTRDLVDALLGEVEALRVSFTHGRQLVELLSRKAA